MKFLITKQPTDVSLDEQEIEGELIGFIGKILANSLFWLQRLP